MRPGFLFPNPFGSPNPAYSPAPTFCDVSRSHSAEQVAPTILKSSRISGNPTRLQHAINPAFGQRAGRNNSPPLARRTCCTMACVPQCHCIPSASTSWRSLSNTSTPRRSCSDPSSTQVGSVSGRPTARGRTQCLPRIIRGVPPIPTGLGICRTIRIWAWATYDTPLHERFSPRERIRLKR